MGVLTRLAAWWLERSGTIEDWFREFGDLNKSATGIAVTQFRAMQASTVMACVSMLSEDVAKLPAHVYRRQKDGGKTIVADHPLEKLLRKPNAWQTRFEFVEFMQAALLLRGNAYAPIVRNGRGVPIGLVPVNPDRVSLFESPGGALFYCVQRHGMHDMAALETLPLMIPAEDMLHLRWLSQNSLSGLSRIGLAREAIALSLAQERHAAQLFGNGARPGGVLQTDKRLGKETIERLKTQWKANYGGENTGSTAVLEEGLKWQALGMTSVDAEFLASRRFQVEEIGRMFRVPGHKLGILPAGGTGPSAVQADQDYMNNVVSSYVERWEAKLDDTFGLSDAGLFVEFDVNRFLRADIQTRYAAYRTAIVGTFMKPNEARRLEGLPDDPKGDVLLQPTNVAPLGFVPTNGNGSGSGPGSDVTGSPAPGGDGDPAAVAPPGGDA